MPYFLLQTREWRTAQASALEFQMSASSSHHVAILISSLADFQKGQCIFWLAIDAAVLVALGGSAQTLGARSLASFSANLSALKTICLSALVFVTFGLYCLHTARKRSWYIFSLSMLTSVLSVIAYVLTRFARADNLAPDPDAPSIKGCGRISPTTYCDIGDTADYNQSLLSWLRSRRLYLAMFISAGIINLGLLVDIVMHNTAFAKRPALQILHTSGAETPRWRCMVASTMRAFVEILFLIFLGFLFTDLIMIYYTGGGSRGGMNVWGFGQIIALTIWIPVLLEWLYAATREYPSPGRTPVLTNLGGLENASDHRIVEPYRLIRTDTKTRNRIGWDYNKVASADFTTNGFGTLLNDLPRRRTDIEHRRSLDQGPSVSPAPYDTGFTRRDDDAPLIKRKALPAPIATQDPEQDITHASGADLTPLSRSSTMTQRGERTTERPVI